MNDKTNEALHPALVLSPSTSEQQRQRQHTHVGMLPPAQGDALATESVTRTALLSRSHVSCFPPCTFPIPTVLPAFSSWYSRDLVSREAHASQFLVKSFVPTKAGPLWDNQSQPLCVRGACVSVQRVEGQCRMRALAGRSGGRRSGPPRGCCGQLLPQLGITRSSQTPGNLRTPEVSNLWLCCSRPFMSASPRLLWAALTTWSPYENSVALHPRGCLLFVVRAWACKVRGLAVPGICEHACTGERAASEKLQSKCNSPKEI